jgi:hypothetical protein
LLQVSILFRVAKVNGRWCRNHQYERVVKGEVSARGVKKKVSASVPENHAPIFISYRPNPLVIKTLSPNNKTITSFRLTADMRFIDIGHRHPHLPTVGSRLISGSRRFLELHGNR